MTSPAHVLPPGEASHVLAGGGEMGALMRSIDWAATPIGPVPTWPQSLRTVLSILLNCRHPIFVWWGPELVQFYNDAYRPILGATKHPAAMGQRGRECWREIWDVIEPMITAVMDRGEATFLEDSLLVLDRNGFLEECYFVYAYSPIRDEAGNVAGVFVACNETTAKVLGARRLRTLRDLADRTVGAKSQVAACQIAARVLDDIRTEIAFAALYLLGDEGAQAHLIDTVGVAPGSAVSPAVIDLAQDTTPGWPIAALRSISATRIDDLGRRFGTLPGGPWPESPDAALVLPIPGSNQDQRVGFLIVGLSPRLPFDDDYRGFLDLVAGHIGTAVLNARAYEEERRRAAALAEIDRAKTAFFSNVSHEFRTPLTLMLGPIEESLADTADPLPLPQRERQMLAYRNGLRLLKLVNTLLDFARIEAGRVQATFALTDLAAFTTHLAGVFRSAVERAGLQFNVACAPITEPVYVDRELWEKIVFNLISNAFKFTFEGTIDVTLIAHEGAVELRVHDTGTGIPADEVPRLFERFHRVAGAQGRTHEGSGIGLALVQELVRIHGGSITVGSAVGVGSTFRVTLPTGSAHLPRELIIETPTDTATSVASSPFLEEAIRWLPGDGVVSPERLADLPDGAPPDEHHTANHATRLRSILVVDDNADMRTYLTQLLAPIYAVSTAGDGEQALMAIRRKRPDLVLTDMMMPRLDGFGLLQAIRGDDQIRDLPVVMLSARAGEEATIEGLQAGANDYLVKPFAARELLARVDAALELADLRQDAAKRTLEERERLRRLFRQLPAIISVLREPGHIFDLVNDHYQQIFPDRPLLNRPFAEVLPEIAAQGMMDILDQVIRTGTPYMATAQPFAIDMPGGDTDVNYYDFAVTPLLDEAGAVHELLLFAVDVSEGVRARLVIEQSVDRITRLQSMAASLAEAITTAQVMEVMLQQGMAALAADRAAVGLLTEDQRTIRVIGAANYPDEMVARWSPLSIDLHAPWADVARSGSPSFIESADDWAARYPALQPELGVIGALPLVTLPLTVEHTTFGVFSASFAEARTFDADDRAFLLSLARICAQALERARLYEAEQHARERAEEATHLREQFLSIAAHELRTPLTSLLTYAQALQRRLTRAGTLNNRDQRSLQQIVEQARRLNKLIGMLLDISRIEAGRLSIEKQPVDLIALVQHVVEDARAGLEMHTIVLHVPDSGVTVLGDELRLEQVVQNLLHNAIKYSPTGGRIELRIERHPTQVAIIVADQGIGIPKANQINLFQQFYRADNVAEHQISGMGIGLYVVREIIAMHGGGVHVTSVEGSGSIFTVWLPA